MVGVLWHGNHYQQHLQVKYVNTTLILKRVSDNIVSVSSLDVGVISNISLKESKETYGVIPTINVDKHVLHEYIYDYDKLYT